MNTEYQTKERRQRGASADNNGMPGRNRAPADKGAEWVD